MTAKEKRIRTRLEQIRDEASAYAEANEGEKLKIANLAEEAASLGLDLLHERNK